MAKREKLQLDPVAVASGPIRVLRQFLEGELFCALEEVGRTQNLENLERDALMTASLRGQIALLRRLIDALSARTYIGGEVDLFGKSEERKAVSPSA